MNAKGLAMFNKLRLISPSLKLITNVSIAIMLLALSATVASGNTTHTTSGLGTHNAASHGNNPAHIWVDVHWPNDGSISSGGRYHDPPYCNPVCYPAFYGDLSLDIDAADDAESDLWLNYAGYSSDSYTTDPPDGNNSVYVFAYVTQGNISGGDPACEYQRYDVHIYYWDTGGTFHDASVGSMWVLHNDNWTYGPGTWIYPNGVMSNPYGSGTVYFINDIKVGTVYPGAGACSSGSHTHVEFYSAHDWGPTSSGIAWLGPTTTPIHMIMSTTVPGTAIHPGLTQEALTRLLVGSAVARLTS